MDTRRTLQRVIAFIIGVVGTLLLIELGLRTLPILEGTTAADARPSWPLRTYQPDSEFTYSSGWDLQNVHRGRINNLGYLAPFDYQPGRAEVAVLGDSYIESQMNDYRDTLQGVLGRELGSPEAVLNFGTAGASLPHYLGAAQLVRDRFKPRWGVVLVTAGDYNFASDDEPGFYRWAAHGNPPIELVPEIERTTARKIIRSLAIVRYVRAHLSFRLGNLIQARRSVEARPAVCREQALSEQEEMRLATFIEYLPGAFGLPAQQVILVADADRMEIYASQGRSVTQCMTRVKQARSRLMQLAQQRGMRLIDTEPLFREHYLRTRERVDYSPRDAHWNPIAHRLVAEQIAPLIKESQGTKAVP